MPAQLTWKRTGEITLRAEPYLIIRYPGSRYACFVRDAKGELSPLAYGLPSAEAAKAVCEDHGASLGAGAALNQEADKSNDISNNYS